LDLANGAAATADGLIPFGDPFADLYQNGDIWSDDNEGLSDYERSLYEKSKTGGKVAQVCLTAAAGTGLWNALRLPTMSIGGAMPPAGGYTPHFFWSVTTRAGTTTMHTLGRSTTVGAEFWGGYLGGPTSITRIPILFPGAAARAGVASPNCLTGMCGALRRGIIGFWSMALPVYISDESVMPQLMAAMKQVGLNLHQVADGRNTAEGTEQDWKCSDEAGDLFALGTCEVNEKNGLRLRAGTFCLIPGPGARGRKHKEIAEAYKSFERVLAALGVQQMPRK